MKKRLNILIFFVLIASSTLVAKIYKVTNMTELNYRIKTAVPCDAIIMANGIWKDVEIVFKAKGTENKPICLAAETAGKVLIEGASNLSISGEYLDVQGLVFTKGHTPTRTVVLFKTSETEYAYHCRLYGCVIDKFNQPIRETEDNWVSMWGKNNSVEYCYFGGKTNVGTTLIVCPNDSNSINNQHFIYQNYFGPRPRLGSNGGETIRIGTSEVCTNSSKTNVCKNYFDHCNGEVEIISNKSCDNIIQHNTFYECEGSVVLRHGNHATVAGNWFAGNGKPFTGGVRVINEGHQIYNNFFYKLRGDEFRSPLTVMNGIPNSPASGYAPVKNVILANNTWFDCTLPWNFCVGVSERNRIVTPQNTQIINNIVYSPNDSVLIKSYDKTDGITFGNNLMINKKGLVTEKGTVSGKIYTSYISHLEMAYTNIPAKELSFIKNDIMIQPRINPVVGAFQDNEENVQITIANSKNCGPEWYKADTNPVQKGITKGKTIKVKPGTDNLYDAVNKANEGDILMLDSGIHILTKKIQIFKSLTFLSSSKLKSKPVIKMQSTNADEPLFEINSGAILRVKGLKIDGKGDNKNVVTPKFAFATAPHALGYSLFIDNCDIFDFSTKGGSIFNCLYCTMADSIVISNSVLRDSYRGINLAEEKEDGKYNAETVIFNNTVFSNFSDYALNYYRGGYDESTIGGSLAVNHCVFDGVGNQDCEAVLKLTRIMYVKINNSIFSNSTAKSSMQLWYLYDKITHCCIYNCPKPELIKGAKSSNLIFENPYFEKGSFKLAPNSTLIGKTSDGKNIGLR